MIMSSRFIELPSKNNKDTVLINRNSIDSITVVGGGPVISMTVNGNSSIYSFETVKAMNMWIEEAGQ
jgi:hypothetical protein